MHVAAQSVISTSAMYAAANRPRSKPSRRARLPALVAVVAMITAGSPRRGRAQPAGPVQAVCSDTRVQVDGALSDAWLDAVKRLCDGLARMNHVDPSARLRIAQNGADLVVQAALADGRVA